MHRIIQAAQQAEQALQQIQQIAQQLNQSQQAGNFAGSSSAMQPGFAGTNSQQVRQDISSDLNNANQGTFGQQTNNFMPQAGNFASAMHPGFAGSSSNIQSGFAGTNPQQVRQDISSDLNNANQGNQ